MAHGNFTDKYIRSLKPKTKEYWVREGKGFSIRVYPSGAKRWYYIFTDSDGKKRFMPLGVYPDVSLSDARKKFDDAQVGVKNVNDPLSEHGTAKVERDLTPIVDTLVDEFIARYAKQNCKGWQEIERSLNAEIVSKWGKRKITDIRRRDLVCILDAIKERGAPVMANRVLAYTRKMFSWAVERDLLEMNPFLGMSRPNEEKSRERLLSKTEIKALWSNLDDATMSESIRRALKLILVTGQRPGEVIGMHRAEIDDSGRWWTIPSERSWNNQAHRVYLTDLAQKLIGNVAGYVFASPRDPERSYDGKTLTHDIKANLPHTPDSKVVDRLKIAHFVPHDLRRTAANIMAEAGVTGDIIDKVQNHISKQKAGVGHIYDRNSYDKEKQIALEKLERKLNSIITEVKVKK